MTSYLSTEVPFMSDVEVVRTGDPKYGATWTISFKGMPYQPQVTILSDLSTNVESSATSQSIQLFRNVMEFPFLDYNFMYLHKEPQPET